VAIHGYPMGIACPVKMDGLALHRNRRSTQYSLLIERPDLSDNPFFSEPRVRMAEPEKFDILVVPWLEEHDKWEITRKPEATAGFHAILSPRELTEDQQIQAREFLAQTEHPVMGDVTYPGTPAKLSESPWQIGRAPLLGEHTEEILGQLGFTVEALTRLRAAGVI